MQSCGILRITHPSGYRRQNSPGGKRSAEEFCHPMTPSGTRRDLKFEISVITPYASSRSQLFGGSFLVQTGCSIVLQSVT